MANDETVPFQKINFAHDRGQYIIRDQTTLDAMVGERKYLLQGIDVDFERDIIIGVSRGFVSSGYNVVIERVIRNEQGLAVHYRENDPRPGAAYSASMHTACYFATVPKQEGKVEFHKIE